MQSNLKMDGTNLITKKIFLTLKIINLKLRNERQNSCDSRGGRKS